MIYMLRRSREDEMLELEKMHIEETMWYMLALAVSMKPVNTVTFRKRED